MTHEERADGDLVSGGQRYQSFLVVIGLGIDTDDHSDFALSVKVVLEQMGEFGVSVGDHLSDRTLLAALSISRVPSVPAALIHTLFVLYIWFSRSTSMQVRRVSKD